MSTLRFSALVAAAFLLGAIAFSKPGSQIKQPVAVADSGRTSRAEFAASAALARDINSTLELSRQ